MTDDSYYVRKRSSRPEKKWMVRVPTSSGRGKVVHFGDSSMQDFTQHKDTDRRERYRNRHQRDNLDDPGSPGFWSWHALWGESSNLKTAFAAAVRRAKKLGGAKRNPEETPRGTCFRDAAQEATEFPDAKLVHGRVEGIVNIENHAWVELADGRILDVTTLNDPRPSTWYAERGLHYIAETVYDPYEALALSVRTGNWGPWTEQERRQRRAKRNPDAGALHERFEELCDLVSSNAALVVDEEAALAGRDPDSPRAFAATDGYVVYVRPKLAEQTVERIDGVLMHELGHVILIQSGYPDHTERECDACAEGAFGIAICYDADDVQTTGLGVRPRPAHLDLRHNPDDESGCGC